MRAVPPFFRGLKGRLGCLLVAALVFIAVAHVLVRESVRDAGGDDGGGGGSGGGSAHVQQQQEDTAGGDEKPVEEHVEARAEERAVERGGAHFSAVQPLTLHLKTISLNPKSWNPKP
jgi:hypothetical protein